MKPKPYLRNRLMIKPKNNFVAELKWIRNWAKRRALFQFQISDKIGKLDKRSLGNCTGWKCTDVLYLFQWKASISLTERWRCNGLKSNGSAHFHGYCSCEMGLFEDSGSNFILLNSEITEAFPKQSLSLKLASRCTMSLLCTKFEGLVCNTILSVTAGAVS